LKIGLEASSVCQLKCPSCPTASKAILPVVGNGFLNLRDFQKLLDESPWLKEIELSNWGEIFLNPGLLEIIKYAYERDVALKADNGVNLNHVKESILEGLVKYKFRSMTCSIDGASNETYKVYRVRGNFETAIENIKKINFFKRKYQSEYPQLAWQFVVFGHNEHEIQLARKLASDLNMNFYLKLTWDNKFSPVRDQEFVRKEVDAVSREEYKKKHGVDYMGGGCYQLWDQPQINWDGKVLGCCRNLEGDFGGNAFRDGLLESLNNEKIKYAREMLLGKKVARGDIPCTTCPTYLGMRADGKWLRRRSPSLPYRALRFIYRSLGLQHLRQELRNHRWLL
jgi:MoaA/NifB/PqqE/SkfB family radical SAM enzyme